jgi:hypothetical protein
MLHATGASSPELPDLNDLIKSQKLARPPLKSGSKAAPIPDDALAGFTTARGLWQSAQSAEASSESVLQTADPIYLSGEDDSVCIIEAPAKIEKPTKKPGKPRQARRQTVKATAPATLRSHPEPSSPRTPSKEQPWRKYLPSPKGVSESPTSENVAFEAPPSAQIPEEEPRLLETESVSKHFRLKRLESKEELKAVPIQSEPVVLDPAPLRRLDWTPPAKDAVLNEALDHDSDTRQVDSPKDEDQVVFKDLLRDYSCSESATKPGRDGIKAPAAGLGKRKLIEPVVVREGDISERSRSSSPTKKKAPKKPRTLTELATAAYRIQDEPEAPPSSLLNYVTVNSGDSGMAAQSDSKGKAKPRKKAAPRKKGASAKPELLSPGAALKHVANQDFVFGTSSQLAQERSPTFLRSLHTAMRQSNDLDEGAFDIPLNSDDIEIPKTRSRLWDAAARDADGELFDVEVVNLIDASPTLSRIPEEADPFGYGNGEGAGQDHHQALGAATDPEDSLLSLSETLPRKASMPLETSDMSTKANVGASEAGQRPDCQTILTVPEDIQEPTLPPLPVEAPVRPAYESFTDGQLAKQVSSFGFKPVKRRATMIALLDNCWKSQVASGRLTSVSPKRGITTKAGKSATSPRPRGRPKKTASDVPVTADSTAPVEPVTPTKKPRGRPRKDAAIPTKVSAKATASRAKKTNGSPTRKGKGKAKTAATKSQSVLEIPDSESDQASVRSASRSVSPDPMFSSPAVRANLAITRGDDDTEMSLTMTPTDQQASLNEHITKAVTSAPRSKDVTDPSWYEKMLLYDPIVVEDLAAWLNSGQLTNAGYDGEVSAAEVKKWCESKSVCCLWRDTHRGKERKRY